MPQEKLNIKPAEGGLAIPWHQDWAFFPHTNDSVLTASVLIDDSTKENGNYHIFGSIGALLFNLSTTAITGLTEAGKLSLAYISMQARLMTSQACLIMANA